MINGYGVTESDISKRNAATYFRAWKRDIEAQNTTLNTLEKYYRAKYNDGEDYKRLKEYADLVQNHKVLERMPHVRDASTTQEKLYDYLLDVDGKTKSGRTKAHVIQEVLGYKKEDWREFAQLLYDEVQQGVVIKVERGLSVDTPGFKYTVPLLLQGEKHNLLLKTIWQIDDDSLIPRIITAVPGKKY